MDLERGKKDSKMMEPVIIEGDVKKMNREMLAQVQLSKFGCLFHVIYIHPPRKVNLIIPYPVLTDKDILNIPFRTL